MAPPIRKVRSEDSGGLTKVAATATVHTVTGQLLSFAKGLEGVGDRFRSAVSCS
ncbi:hypothetical protein DES53_11730 [Roseimicrobium gellanilyticum]|uniref:Uncharacterized protein n=1 Tax=Roseimicrobium gellanilyticum TaxID=748857 RepID=A0A366H4S6_9BACT|nr:hypothetical protein DES53_11730 [Roseimicrobium gellanilyticum]